MHFLPSLFLVAFSSMREIILSGKLILLDMYVNPSQIQVIVAKGFPPEISQVNTTIFPSITGPLGFWVIVGSAGASNVVSKYYNIYEY